MKKSELFLCLILFIFTLQTKERKQPLELWYDHPAKVWEEALPLRIAKIGR